MKKVKLQLNKETIANLNQGEMNVVRGGSDCGCSVCPNHCASQGLEACEDTNIGIEPYSVNECIAPPPPISGLKTCTPKISAYCANTSKAFPCG